MILLASATAITLPAFANAAVVVFENTVSVDQNYSFATTIMPGDTQEWTFTTLDDLVISSFAVSGTGTEAADDLANVTFGLALPTTEGFTVIAEQGNAANGAGFIPGASFAAGDTFTVFFSDSLDNDVAVTLSFLTQAAVIPLPATGLLLAPFLAAGGFAGWRRRKAARANAV